VKKKVQKIFEENGLKIEISVNKNIVDFLDITLDMKMETYQPFTKPNRQPLYVHKQFNHPPSILKNIPLSVNDRLSRLSSTKEIFDIAAPPYQKALADSGCSHKLEFKDMSGSRKKNRSRILTYLNPPFSLNVKTNIGKQFLNLIRNFPTNNILRQIVKPNTIKLSYRTSKNMSSEISRHNNRILQSEDDRMATPRCNCQAALKENCPYPG